MQHSASRPPRHIGRLRCRRGSATGGGRAPPSPNCLCGAAAPATVHIHELPPPCRGDTWKRFAADSVATGMEWPPRPPQGSTHHHRYTAAAGGDTAQPTPLLRGRSSRCNRRARWPTGVAALFRKVVEEQGRSRCCGGKGAAASTARRHDLPSRHRGDRGIGGGGGGKGGAGVL